MLPVVEVPLRRADGLAIDAALAERWLVAFLRDELVERRGIARAVLGLSGGIDSALVAYLCARALGPENVYAIRMPYRTSSADSLADAQAVVDALGINVETIDISSAVDGYLQFTPDADARRRGNVMARMRMLVLFDQSARLGCAAGRHGQQDRTSDGLFYLARRRYAAGQSDRRSLQDAGVGARAAPRRSGANVIDKPPSADLEANQTDETDLGITYLARGSDSLSTFSAGYRNEQIVAHGFDANTTIALVRRRVEEHALETTLADDGARLRDRDQRILPASGGLLSAAQLGPEVLPPAFYPVSLESGRPHAAS